VQRKPEPGLIAHSDRGTQYAATDYQQQLKRHAMVCSMSRKGDCWDNAVAESFFATLKVELLHRGEWPTRDAAKSAIFRFIETWYNTRRRHSTLGYLRPAASEEVQQRAAVA